MRAGGGGVEAAQQLGQRRLACPVGPHDGDHLAGTQLQVDVDDGVALAGRVPVTHVLEADDAAECWAG